MIYTLFTVGEKEYKCRLTAKSCVDLEKRIGGNPLNIFTKIRDNSEMPRLQDMMYILHASLQAYNHGITLDDTYEIYDEFINNGNSLMELIPIIIEIFKVSGFFKEEVIEKN